MNTLQGLCQKQETNNAAFREDGAIDLNQTAKSY